MKQSLLSLLFLFTLNSFADSDKKIVNNNQKAANITIFIHGTRKLSRLFFSYSNKLNELVKVKELNKKYCTHNLAKFICEENCKEFSLEDFYVFGWSGALSHEARLEAAQMLHEKISKLIEKYRQRKINPKITLITHSHGGNVALNLANPKIKNNTEISIDRLVLLACPIQVFTKDYVDNAMFKKIYNIYSTMDMTQILDPQGFYKSNKKNKQCPILSERRFKSKENLKQSKIKINDRGLCHVEFICKKFLKNLPKLLDIMDTLIDYKHEHLIKIYTKNTRFKIVS